jgi:hypothetical protein
VAYLDSIQARLVALRELQSASGEQELASMPPQIFSERTDPAPGTRAVFSCYRLPGPDASGQWNKDTSLKSRQAPAGEKPVLKAWMEMN